MHKCYVSISICCFVKLATSLITPFFSRSVSENFMDTSYAWIWIEAVQIC